MPITLNGSNGITFPSWTTATRPSSPSAGQTGYNSTTGSLEVYNGSAWGSAGGMQTASVQTGNFAATAGNIYPVNTTSAAITVTLPASPSAGNMITIIDYAGTAATNNITINPNGNKIQGTYTGNNAIISTNRQAYNLLYVDSTQGWIGYADQTSGVTFNPYTVTYLAVAGGGSGGGGTGWEVGGGGGAGGYLTSTASFSPSQVYTITVGAGGTGVVPGGNNGNNSVISGTGVSVTAIGGGRGNGGIQSVGSGGSGGGQMGNTSSAGGSGTAGQGNNGGNGSVASDNSSGGGGGGASAVGSNASSPNGGAGGAGSSSSITGSSVTYAGGGGGSAASNGSGTNGSGGSGGGAAGNAGAGTTNTGGGGGGTRGSVAGGSGGSGVVILSVPTAYYSGNYTGSPTVTTSGSNTILKFTASGTYTA